MLRRLRIENLVLVREAELEFGDGLNAITGETGAGKTIIAQAIGLLLGEKGDAGIVGAAGREAYVEAELDVPEKFFEADGSEALAEMRPEDESGLVLGRRVFADGRTRAYAWGRSVARDELVEAGERLIAMSGQFEQRRLARPSFQLDVLDAYCGLEQDARRRSARAAWRELQAARRDLETAAARAAMSAGRHAELRALAEATAGFAPGEEDRLRLARDRLKSVTELGDAANAALAVIAPEDGDGAALLTATAERVLEPHLDVAPELESPLREVRDAAVRLEEAARELHRFLGTLQADPARLEEAEDRLAALAAARRRFSCQTTDELLALRDAAVGELAALESGVDPVSAAEARVEEAEAAFDEAARGLHGARRAACAPFAAAVESELRGVGMGDGAFRVELSDREPGPTGCDAAAFLIRPNPGLPFASAAETASGGELSRIALALAVVAGGETLVFDEIDAGIGGVTAHRVAETLARLAESAQVVTITHLPQIASAAERHFRVEKIEGDPTQTRIERLDERERKHELERMLGGEEFLATVAASER
jgi:DNA repair protein RecN (Recombination protein N)